MAAGGGQDLREGLAAAGRAAGGGRETPQALATAGRPHGRRVTYLLLSIGAGEALLVLGAVLLGHAVPFTVSQLLWLDLVILGILAAALVFEPAGDPGPPDRSPPRPPAPLLDRSMLERTLLAGATFATVGLGLWSYLDRSHPVPEARNLVVQLFVLFQLVHLGNARSETVSRFRLGPFRNRWLLPAMLVALGVHVAALYQPFFQELLGVHPIHPVDWVVLAVLSAPVVLVVEVHKRIGRSGSEDPEGGSDRA